MNLLVTLRVRAISVFFLGIFYLLFWYFILCFGILCSRATFNFLIDAWKRLVLKSHRCIAQLPGPLQL